MALRSPGRRAFAPPKRRQTCSAASFGHAGGARTGTGESPMPPPDSGINDLGQMRRRTVGIQRRLTDETAAGPCGNSGLAVERDGHVVIAANAFLDRFRFLRAM